MIIYTTWELEEDIIALNRVICENVVRYFARLKYKRHSKRNVYSDRIKMNINGKSFYLTYQCEVDKESRKVKIITTWADIVFGENAI